MTERTTITKTVIERAAPGSFLRDAGLVGFGVRVSATGTASFVVEARVAGRNERFAMGSVSLYKTVDEARDEARGLLLDMKRGVSPQARRQADREAEKNRAGETFGEQLEAYIAAAGVKESTAKLYRAVVRRQAPEWMGKPITGITAAMLLKKYEAIVQTKKTGDGKVVQTGIGEANNFGRVVRAVMNRAQVVLGDDEDGLPRLRRNAATGLAKRWKATPRRERVLEPTDVSAWWSGVEGLRSRESRLALKVLVLTGLRVNEALSLRWEDVNARTWAVRDSKTGAFRKVVGPRVAEFVAQARPDDAVGPVFGVKDLRAALDAVEKSGGKLVSPHDLRRTFASFCERSGLPITTIKVLLNHSLKNADVTTGYIRISDADQLVATERVEAAILRATEPAADVVPLRRVS